MFFSFDLFRIKDIRLLYGFNPDEDTKIDFESLSGNIEPNGHCIAARITSENPEEGFLPACGIINELSLTSSKHLWGYFSISNMGKLHEYSDSQFGHIFSSAFTMKVKFSHSKKGRKSCVCGTSITVQCESRRLYIIAE